MTSSIQQIEAALAYVQRPSAATHGSTSLKVAMQSCSFDLACKFESAESMAKAAEGLAQVTPPQFCKPLRRIGATVAHSDRHQDPLNQRPRLSYDLTSRVLEVAQAQEVQQPHDLAKPGLDAKSSLDRENLTSSHTVLSSELVAESVDVPSVQSGQVADEAVGAKITDAKIAEVVTTGVEQNEPNSQELRRIRPIQDSEVPDLPRSKSPKFTSHRNGSNPMLPLNLLQDIGKEVVQWQTKLKAVHDAIQSLYGEGPIINAWLESAAGVKTDPAHLGAASLGSLKGVYHVCGLDKNGQVWRKNCPVEQLPQVTVAIARYQKLRQLLSQKRVLDNRLQRLSQALTMLRGGLRAY